jgi:hypothetical protein
MCYGPEDWGVPLSHQFLSLPSRWHSAEDFGIRRSYVHRGMPDLKRSSRKLPSAFAPHSPCMDCAVDTFATGEYYTLKDALWRRINPLVIGIMCLACAEDRLGRSLNRADFARAPINAESAAKCPALARRLNRARPKAGCSMNDVRPRSRKIASKRARQSRLGYTSFQLLGYVGRNGRVRPSDIMSVIRSLPLSDPPVHSAAGKGVSENVSVLTEPPTRQKRKSRQR